MHEHCLCLMQQILHTSLQKNNIAVGKIGGQSATKPNTNCNAMVTMTKTERFVSLCFSLDFILIIKKKKHVSGQITFLFKTLKKVRQQPNHQHECLQNVYMLKLHIS